MGDFQFKKMNNQGGVHWNSDNSGGKPHYDDNFSSLSFNSDEESLCIPVEAEHISYDEELCRTVDSACKALYKNWDGKLFMDTHKKGHDHNQSVDIIHLLNSHGNNSQQSYFDLKKFNVTNGFKSDDFSLLCKELCNKGISNGYMLVKNGTCLRKIDGTFLIMNGKAISQN